MSYEAIFLRTDSCFISSWVRGTPFNAGAEAAASLLRSVFLLHEMRKELRIKSLLIDALLPDLSIWRADALLNVDSQARHAW